MSTLLERRLVGDKGGLQLDIRSPLGQVKQMIDAMPNAEAGPSTPPKHRFQPETSRIQEVVEGQSRQAVPAPDFNLFRSNSVYSVSSLNTISSCDSNTSDESGLELFKAALEKQGLGSKDGRTPRDDEDRSGAETPTTPRANRTGYFESLQSTSIPGASPVNKDTKVGDDTGQITPKRSFLVRSRPPMTSKGSEPGPSSRPLHETHSSSSSLRPQEAPVTAGIVTEEFGQVPTNLPSRNSATDLASIHGEQGSDWGDDEAGFEWLDRDSGIAINGLNPDSGDSSMTGVGRVEGLLASPGKKLAKLKASVERLGEDGISASKGISRKLTKRPVVIPKRAAPPPPPPHTTSSPSHHGSSPIPLAATLELGPVVPPKGPSTSSPIFSNPSLASTIEAKYSPLLARQALHPRSTNPSPDLFKPATSSHQATNGKHKLTPIMVPVRSDSSSSSSSSSSSKITREGKGISVQSIAYSIYDLDGGPSSADTVRGGSNRQASKTPGGSDPTFPKGTYQKVSASALHSLSSPDSHPSSSDPPLSPLLDSHSTSRGELLEKGLKARTEGDLPKAAWYFRQSAEKGSSTGRIYYGLALRHGWGIARDERKAFGELQAACDERLAEGVVELRRSEEGGRLNIKQKKEIVKDLSVGIFEVANCFIEGIGTKRDPGIGVSYLKYAGDLGDLASQEQLGFLYSKGGNGIKKDMKEAARWYRMAIGQGSNSVGLAWVWKEKYMV